jgi:hypothetical protein
MDLAIVRARSSQTATPDRPSNCIEDYRDAQGGSPAASRKQARAI